MKITSKRCFALLLALVMCLGMFQMTAFANEGTEPTEQEQPEVTDKPAATEPPEGTPEPDATETPDEKQEPTQEPTDADAEDDGDVDIDEEPEGTEAPDDSTTEPTETPVEPKPEKPAASNGLVITKKPLAGDNKPQEETCNHDWVYDRCKLNKVNCQTLHTDVYRCSKCELTKDVLAQTHSHAMQYRQNVFDKGHHTAYCTRCGWTETLRSHEYNGATCMTPGKCVCGKEDPDEKLAPHTNVIDAAVAPTCTETGLTEGEHCSVCGKVFKEQEVIPAKGHTEVVDKAVAATCTTAGKTEGSHCSDCGTVIVAQTAVPAKGHTYGEWKTTKEATCTEAGSKTRTCTVCGYAETETIAAKGHTEVTDAAVPATCTKTGLTAGSHCSVCNTVLVAQTETPANGHTYGEWITDTPATMESEGTKHHVCTACGHTENGTIPTLDKVTITINYNDGEETVKTESVVVPKDSQYNLAENVQIPEGYVRNGDIEAITADVDKTVTVSVKKIEYTVTFNSNGGSAVASQTVKHGEKATNPTTTRSNYTFNGWTLNGAAYDFNAPVTRNITLVAQWSEIYIGPIVTPTPEPTPDPTPTPTPTPTPSEPDDPIDIPDPDVPTTDRPDLPDQPDNPDDPIDIPDPDVPTTDRPVIPTAPVTPTRPAAPSNGLTEIEDEEVPLADTPETGDNVWVWYLTALLSAAGITVLAVLENKKRAKR